MTFQVTKHDVIATGLLPIDRQVMFANCYAADMCFAVEVISMLLELDDDDNKDVLAQWCRTFDELADHWSSLVVGRL